ncbi:MAG: hypothetical protein ABI809_08130 [Caldimonas sp.]
MTTPTSVGQSPTTDFADKAAESADAAIQTARQKAHDMLDGLSNKMQSVKDQASATLERFRPQLDSVTSYAQQEPTKALLIAAAAGAGIMALAALASRGGGSTRLPSASALRKAAYDAAFGAADDARKSAQDAADDASSRTRSALKSTRNAAQSAYQSAYDGVADTMAQWKDQAAPLVDKIRPQIDTVMTYAKDDPGKALLIAAAAGAALMGLMSSLTR